MTRTGRAVIGGLLVLAPALAVAAGAPPEIEVALARLTGIAPEQGRYEVYWQGVPPAGGEVDLLSFDARARTLTALAREGARARTVQAVVRVMAEVPAPLRPIAGGEVVREGDLGTVEVDLLGGRRDFVETGELAVGQVARRSLSAGRPILARDLKSVPAVRRNDIVTLVAGGLSFTSRTRGKALDGGAVGDAVRVQNLDSRKVVTGLVRTTGEVVVGGAP